MVFLDPYECKYTREWKLLTPLPDPEACTSEHIQCFKHDGEDCPRCDGSGYRPRKHCAGCSEPAGSASKGGKALQPACAAKTWEEARSLPLYCRECNPRFASLKALALSEKKDD